MGDTTNGSFCNLNINSYNSELGLKFNKDFPLATIKSVLKSISIQHKDAQNIILIDEILSVNERSANNSLCNWSNLNISLTNVDFLIAINPQGVKFKNKFKVVPPKSPNTLSKQLIGKHRNSFECDLFVEHFKSIPKTSYLDTCNDLSLERKNLPPGRVPVWIDELEEQTVESILALIEKDHVLNHETVTLIYNKYELSTERRERVDKFCLENDWKFFHQSHYFGCEDMVIILFECDLLFELISRGRNQVVLVTTTG